MSFNISKKAYDAVMNSTRQGVEVSYWLADEPTVDNTPLDILSGEDGQADENPEQVINRITEENIIAGSFSIDRYTASGDNVEIGSAVAAELKMTLDNHTGIYDDVNFAGATLRVNVSVKREDGLISYIPMGIFIVDEQIKNQTTISLTALDYMAAFDKVFDFKEYEQGMSIQQILFAIYNQCMIKDNAESSLGDFLDLPNMDYIPYDLPQSESLTCRQILQWICEITGTCAYMDGDGELQLGFYEDFLIPSTEDKFVLRPNMRYSSEYDKSILVLDKIIVQSKDGNNSEPAVFENEYENCDLSYLSAKGIKSSSLVYTISGNDLISDPTTAEDEETEEDNSGNTGDTSEGTGEDNTNTDDTNTSDMPPELEIPDDTDPSISAESDTPIEGGSGDGDGTTEEVTEYKNKAKEIAAGLKGMKVLRYLPFKATTISMPFLWPLCRIIFEDNHGNLIESIITHHTFKLNGSSTIEAKGVSEQKKGYASSNPLTKHEANIIDKIKDEIKYEITSREKDVLKLNKVANAMFGLYNTVDLQDDGSSILYFHDQEKLNDSKIVYMMNQDGFFWTDEYDKNEPIWQNGATSDGSFVTTYLSTVGLNASWINVEGKAPDAPMRENINKNILLSDSADSSEGKEDINAMSDKTANIYLANGKINFSTDDYLPPTSIYSGGLRTNEINAISSVNIGKFIFESGNDGNLTIKYQGGNN